MQVDGVHALPAGDDEDDGSLFGSPPPSPARGRSPQLALPAGPGPTENVGTIALPGSHYCSELAIDPAVLLFNRPLPQRNPDTPTPTFTPTPTPTFTSTPTHITPPSTLSSRDRPATSRRASRASRNSRNGRDRSATPHAPTPPIHFPDPDEPLPSNFLRSQQALLGHAGLVGGLDLSTLSTRHHRGATSQNPIIIQDELDPPPLGKNDTYSLDPSLLPSPPSEEVVSSLVKQRNVFPVLESLLRLLSGTGVSSTSPAVMPSCSPPPSGSERGVALKRRRLNSVPAGASDWDVPYPFQQGEGPSQYRLHWEKERLRQLLSQLAVVIKGAKRSAAARTYLQQHAYLWASINPPAPQGETCDEQQPIAGVSLCGQHDMPVCPPHVEDVAPTPTVTEASHRRLQTPAAAPQTALLGEFVTSLLYNSIPRISSPSTLTSLSSSSDFLPHHPPYPGSHVTASPMSSRATSAAPRRGSAASTSTPTAQIPPLSDQQRHNQAPTSNKASNKQEIIRRAKHRRQQLVTELEKAKVELWEATIEQGVLNHLMKDHDCQ
jgi:hypothetical protein